MILRIEKVYARGWLARLINPRPIGFRYYVDGVETDLFGRPVVPPVPRFSELNEGWLPCIHLFKGDMCRYSGPATECDKKIATCTRLGNTDHYGGWRL